MKDRFDLEVEIADLYNIENELNVLSYGVSELEITSDEISSSLNGLAIVYRLKIDSIMHTLSQVFNLNKDSEALISDFI